MMMNTPSNPDFQPPIPMSMDAYLDKITENEVLLKDIDRLYFDRVDRAINKIIMRPNPAERHTLFAALYNRFYNHGRSKNWLSASTNKEESPSAKEITALVLADIIGIEASPSDEALKELYDVFINDVEDVLNSKGKKILSLVSLIYSIVTAENENELIAVLAGCGLAGVAKWAKKKVNQDLIRRILKSSGIDKKIRYLILRRVAIFVKLGKKVAGAASRLNPIVTFVEVFLNPTETADDETENRLAFLFLFDRVRKAESRMDDIEFQATPRGIVLLPSAMPTLKNQLH